MDFVTRSPEETRELGRSLGKNLRGGELLALYGELGSGKTRFVQGLAEGLGIREMVTSPTFIYAREMTGRCAFAHVDLYRVVNPDQLPELGILDYLESDWVVAIEWADKGGSLLPAGRIDIRFVDEGENRRRIRMESLERSLDRVLEGAGYFKPGSAAPKK